ncbi:MAG TPA: helix-turn-helix domain-containing protein [Chloroflexota bacterium]|nr:helix-turn-helix domain-containing protein [Chloroflexota bacterium]
MQGTVTVPEAARLLGVSRSKIWNLLREGALTARSNPLDRRQRLIEIEAIEALRQQGRGASPPTARNSALRLVGIVSEPSLQSADFEGTMERHWRPA